VCVCVCERETEKETVKSMNTIIPREIRAWSKKYVALIVIGTTVIILYYKLYKSDVYS
jgi:hypothetical protein